MALPLGNIVVAMGAGAVGTYLANEAGATKFSDILSGAMKFIVKINLKDTAENPRGGGNEATYLTSQVNSLREELQTLLLSRQRQITVLSGGGGGGSESGAVVFPVVCIGEAAGFGYLWWNGWKMSDLMFATRRGLSDACTSVGKQLDMVSGCVAAAKRHLSAKIDGVDKRLDQCAEIDAATKEEVGNLRVDVKRVGCDVESVHRALTGLESKIGRIEGKQDCTNQGVYHLCHFVHDLEQRRRQEIKKKKISMVLRPGAAIEGAVKPAPALLESPTPTSSIDIFGKASTSGSTSSVDIFEKASISGSTPTSSVDIFEKASTSGSKEFSDVLQTPTAAEKCEKIKALESPTSSGLKGFSDALQTRRAQKCEKSKETKAQETPISGLKGIFDVLQTPSPRKFEKCDKIKTPESPTSSGLTGLYTVLQTPDVQIGEKPEEIKAEGQSGHANSKSEWKFSKWFK